MKVHISLTRKTRYAAIVEMTPEQYEEYTDKLEAGGTLYRQALEEIDSLIKPDDWQDDEVDGLDEFEAEEEQAEQQP